MREPTENISEPSTYVLWDFTLNDLDELRSILPRILDDGTVFIPNEEPDEDAPAFPEQDIIPETQLDDFVDNLLHVIPETQPLPEHLPDQSDAIDDDHDGEIENADAREHTVTFKCVGVHREAVYQDILQEVNEQRHRGEEIRVDVELEPENPVDADAVAFVVSLDKERRRIGYVVRECCSVVKAAIVDKTLVSCKFKWVGYRLTFPGGPGFYCGVNLTKTGPWPNVVHRFSSK